MNFIGDQKMAYINEQGYLERKTKSKGCRGGNQSSKRNWWFGRFGSIHLGKINIPKRLQGKKLRFKIEIDD